MSESWALEFKLSVDKALLETAVEAEEAIVEVFKRNAPYDGNRQEGDHFRDTLKPTMTKMGNRYLLGVESDSEKPKAIWLRQGTAGHPIYAQNSSNTLAFDWNGETIFRRGVFHPGTQGSDWEEKAAIEALAVLEKILDVKLRKI